jgi:UDP-3-O-acyl-N-acetylglucosamine deacetylase
VECSGIGLHSGAPVKLRILPAPAGSGIVFRRTDLEGFEVEAISRNVARVSYATSLMKRGVLISTTEHLLSALIGTGIDNAIIELDNLELPILDGSARPFLDLIHKVGIRKQRRGRVYLRILRELELREGNKFIAVYPAENYSVSYTVNFPHPLIGKESFLPFGNRARPYLRISARSRSHATAGIDPRRIGGKCHRAHQRRNHESASAICRRIRPPQSSRPDRRFSTVRKTNPRQRGRRPRRTRHAYRPGFPLAA